MSTFDDRADLMLEHLKRLQANDADLKAKLQAIEMRLTSIETHLTGFFGSLSNHSQALTHHDLRFERIERRLDLLDDSE